MVNGQSTEIAQCSLFVCLLPSGGGWDSQGWSSSMTSSMQLAQECLKDPPEASEEPPAPLEGLEMFAQTIETGEWKHFVCMPIVTCLKVIVGMQTKELPQQRVKSQAFSRTPTNHHSYDHFGVQYFPSIPQETSSPRNQSEKNVQIKI